jgi:hypothetical protein
LLATGSLALTALIHDHLRGADVGAIGLGDGDRSWVGTGAVGRALGGQVGHGGVLLRRVGSERVGNTQSLLEHKANGLCGAARNTEGRMGLDELRSDVGKTHGTVEVWGAT